MRWRHLIKLSPASGYLTEVSCVPVLYIKYGFKTWAFVMLLSTFPLSGLGWAFAKYWQILSIGYDCMEAGQLDEESHSQMDPGHLPGLFWKQQLCLSTLNEEVEDLLSPTSYLLPKSWLVWGQPGRWGQAESKMGRNDPLEKSNSRCSPCFKP